MNATAQPSPTGVTNPDGQTAISDAQKSRPRKARPDFKQLLITAWLGEDGACLADRALEFNRYPTRYAHPSWMPEGWAPWVARMAGNEVLEADLGRSLLQTWDLDASPCFEFAPPARRLALLDPAILRRTVLLAGLARHADEISRLIERERVRELKEQVGEAAYRFVMLRAPLLAGPLAGGASQVAAQEKDWRMRSLAAGLGMLGSCLGPDHAGLTARVLVKFPRDCAPYMEAGGGQGTPDGYLRLFRKVLGKEVDSAWDNLLL